MQIQTQQQNEVRQVWEFTEKTDEDILNLERSKLEMEQMSQMSEDCFFLQKYLELSEPLDDPETCTLSRSLQYFEDLSAEVLELIDKLQSILSGGLANNSVDDLCPKTRKDFLKFYRDITLDLNIANTQLALLWQRVTLISKHTEYPHHSERFCN